MGTSKESLLSGKTKSGRPFWRQALATMGPGLMVCFADTDGPCLVTAATSGADWSYCLLLLQIILIPILFMAQELTARLGLIKGRGIAGVLRMEVGPISAWVVAAPLLCSCALGLVSEYSIVGQLMNQFWNVPVVVTNSIMTLTLLALVLSGSYFVAEKVGLLMGACQSVFLVTMFTAGPSGEQMGRDLIKFPLGDAGFVKLVTANIGAVIMPWMLAYQQSAVCNKGLSEHWEQHLFLERIDTALGSVLTQGVMAGMLVTVAAVNKAGHAVGNINDLLGIFTVVLNGETKAKWLLTFAMIGACMVAAIVQTLCGAWVLEEAVMGNMQDRVSAWEAQYGDQGCLGAIIANVQERPIFYLAYFIVCCGAFAFTMIVQGEFDVSVITEFLNGVLMPPVVFALWYLGSFKLPPEHRLGTCYRWVTFVLFAVCSVFCIVSIFFAFEGDSE